MRYVLMMLLVGCQTFRRLPPETDTGSDETTPTAAPLREEIDTAETTTWPSDDYVLVDLPLRAGAQVVCTSGLADATAWLDADGFSALQFEVLPLLPDGTNEPVIAPHAGDIDHADAAEGDVEISWDDGAKRMRFAGLDTVAVTGQPWTNENVDLGSIDPTKPNTLTVAWNAEADDADAVPWTFRVRDHTDDHGIVALAPADFVCGADGHTYESYLDRP